MGKRTSVNGVTATPLTPYQTTLRSLSDRLVEAQRPLRILDSLRWEGSVEQAFFAAGCRELPSVTRDCYCRRPLPFDPTRKREELFALEADLCRRLGDHDPAGRIILRLCREARTVVDLLVARGTPAFGTLAGRLYGSYRDRLHDGGPSLGELGPLLAGMLDRLPAETGAEAAHLDARQAAALLSARLAEFFPDGGGVRVRPYPGLAADAMAGGDSIKLRADARFSPRAVRLLEVHEGWVHLGTTRNGQSQPICTFLGKGAPSTTTTQEGLAVVTEVLSLASHPARLRRLVHRVEGVARAEAGANFLEVYRYFMEQGYEAHDSYHQTMRIFRGSLPEGCGPFTKDLCYGRGFVLVAGFLRAAVRRGQAHRIPLLFCGKTNLADLKTLAQLADEGLLQPPRYLPPLFADLYALAAWVCLAFLSDAAASSCLDAEYDKLF
jgi:uncharacterized protein (TIGR02421 family)